MSKEERAIVIADSSGAIIPSDLDGVQRVAGLILASGIAPKGMGSVAALSVAIMHGAEIGLKPMQSVQSIAVINGRPSIWGDAALALIESSGLLEDFFEERLTDDKGALTGYRCVAKRLTRSRPIDVTYTVDDAKLAGLWGKGGPWKQYPARMLQMRARGFALRDGFPDVLKGLVTAEEAQDYRMRDVTPAEEMPEKSTAEVLKNISKPQEIEAYTEPAQTADSPNTKQSDDVKALKKKLHAYRKAVDAGYYGIDSFEVVLNRLGDELNLGDTAALNASDDVKALELLVGAFSDYCKEE